MTLPLWNRSQQIKGIYNTHCSWLVWIQGGEAAPKWIFKVVKWRKFLPNIPMNSSFQGLFQYIFPGSFFKFFVLFLKVLMRCNSTLTNISLKYHQLFALSADTISRLFCHRNHSQVQYYLYLTSQWPFYHGCLFKHRT